MTKTIYVTTAQRQAAQLIVQRDAARGRETDPAIKKIAEARPSQDAETVADRPGVAARK